MARLDRLGSAKDVAQVGAVIGREFSYELLRALLPIPESELQGALRELAGVELVYVRGIAPDAVYQFKHALIRDAAYQALLKSRRRQLHQLIAQLLATKFSQSVTTQPELLAYHYSEGGLQEQALLCWQEAGSRAAEHSANAEAISHLTAALRILNSLPDSPEHAARELKLQTLAGPVLIAIKGNASPEVEQAYLRARELSQCVGETVQLFPVLFGLRSVYLVRGEIIRAHELSEQLLGLAQTENDTDHLIEAHLALGNTLHLQGMLVPSRVEFERGLRLYDPRHHKSHAFVYGLDPGVFCLGKIVWVLSFLGYPDQADEKACELIAMARHAAHPLSLVIALNHAGHIRQLRGEINTAHELYSEALRLSTEQGFANLVGQSMVYLGSALGQHQDGIAKMRQGLRMCESTRAVLYRPLFLHLLAEEYLRVEPKEGLAVVAEAQDAIGRTGERLFEAEILRIKGELLLTAQLSNRDALREAEESFLKAIEIARQQAAKSWELRATTSLCRLWQQMGKLEEPRRLLADIHEWFTEGFETGDLREARELLETLS
jgi:tetratricopeptide (TPR) repeat protein